MNDTEGAWGPWGAVAGGFGSGMGYAYGTYITQSPWSLGNFGLVTSAGAAHGLFAGPASAIWGFNSALIISIGSAVNTRNGW